MGADIRRWVEDLLETSQNHWIYRTAKEEAFPEDYNFLPETFPRHSTRFRGSGILLTGTDSHGSQVASIKLLERFAEDGCRCVFLDDAILGRYTAAQAADRINALLDYCIESGESLILVVEGLEEYPGRRELLKYLGEQLWNSLLDPGYPPLFLILIDFREQDIPNLLRRRLQLYRTNVPNQARRTAYVEKYAASLKEFLSLEQFARLTEGADYAQLRDLVILSGQLLAIRNYQPLTEAELAAFLEEQLPAPPPEDATQKLCRTLERLAEQMPQTAAAYVPPAAAPIQAPAAPAITDQAAYLSSKRNEIENMAPNLLCIDVMGADFDHRARQPI